MKMLSNKFWYLLLFAIGVTFTSCDEDDRFDGFASGGLVEAQNALLNYLVGDVTADYTVSLLVPQGDVVTTSVEVWASFNNALGSGEPGLIATFPVSHTVNSDFVSGTFSYLDLRAATRQADGSELPEDDLLLIIGDSWTLTYKGITSGGNGYMNGGTTILGVATRFAGTYNVIDKDYWRILEDRSDLDGGWPATMDVKSIDASTYELLDWWGLFNGNELFFQIDPAGVITYPENNPSGTPQTGNDQPLTTCDLNPGDLTNVFCDEPLTNTAIKVEPSKADLLYMAWGYYTAGSGPREFYQVLEKVVD